MDIHIHRTFASVYTQAGTHARRTSPGASSARATARTCTWTRCSPVHARSHSPHKHPSTYRYRTRLSLYIDTSIHTHIARATRAQPQVHLHSWRRTCAHGCCRSQRLITMKTMIYKYTRVAYIDRAVTRRELPELSVHIYAPISCIHMLVCQLHIPGVVDACQGHGHISNRGTRNRLYMCRCMRGGLCVS